MKWAIFGIAPADYYGQDSFEEVAATFDTKEGAQKYLKASRLKRPQPHKYPYNVFRNRSILTYYCDAYVGEYCPEEPTHEPEITWQ